VARLTKSKWTSSESGAESYFSFGQKYLKDPSGFVKDCFLWGGASGNGPTDYQCEIMDALVNNRRVSVRGPHGLGKSALASWLILWFALTRDASRIDWKIPTTASSWRQLTKFLWPEVHKWHRRVNWLKVGRNELRVDELMTQALRMKYGEAFALASNRPDLIEGAHADNILYVFDESKAIPDGTWDSAEGALVNSSGAYWFSISTPGEPNGRFFEIQSGTKGYEDWWVRKVSAQEALDAGRMEMPWLIASKERWGETSSIYMNKALGEFAQSEEDSLIPLLWVEQSMGRWERAKSKRKPNADSIGVDVARMGGDKTVIALKYGNFVDELDKHGMITTSKGTGIVMNHMKNNPGCIAHIDIIGVGAGVFDRVSEDFNFQDGFDSADRVFAFHVQSKTDFVDENEVWEFKNLYSAAWWNLRQMLDPDKGEDALILPNDSDLKQELMKFRYSVDSNGRIYVLSKEKVKEELGRSPDCADAVVMACWSAEEGGMESA